VRCDPRRNRPQATVRDVATVVARGERVIPAGWWIRDLGMECMTAATLIPQLVQGPELGEPCFRPGDPTGIVERPRAGTRGGLVGDGSFEATPPFGGWIADPRQRWATMEVRRRGFPDHSTIQRRRRATAQATAQRVASSGVRSPRRATGREPGPSYKRRGHWTACSVTLATCRWPWFSIVTST